MDLPEDTALNDLLGGKHAFSLPPLRPDNNNAVVLAGGLDHPLPFVDEDGHRLFDINIFARRAGKDAQERMPVVRRGDNDSRDILVLVHLPEIVVPLCIGAFHVGEPLFHPRLIGVAHAQQFDIFELLEVRDVLFADQTKADDTNADPVVGAQHTDVGCCRHDRCTCRSKKYPPGGFPGLDGSIEHRSCRFLHIPILSLLMSIVLRSECIGLLLKVQSQKRSQNREGHYASF